MQKESQLRLNGENYAALSGARTLRLLCNFLGALRSLILSSHRREAGFF